MNIIFFENNASKGVFINIIKNFNKYNLILFANLFGLNY